MKIRIIHDGREFDGTAEQIVRQMHSLSFGGAATLGEYVDWAAEQARGAGALGVRVEGSTEAERAGSLLDGMLRSGLAVRLA